MTAVRASVVSTSLSFLGPGDLEHHALDSPHTIRSSQLLRLLTRQLVGYQVGSVVPAPDVARELPTIENGGLSEDGRTYRLRLRRGVFWDSQGARELTAGDFVRGLKRVALPTAAHARRYFAETIEGMAEYCEAFDETFGDRPPTAPDLAQFQVTHDVAGLTAPDRDTVMIRLVEPANDFLHILATSLAAAAPREYDYYLPDNPALHRNAPSAGPYRIVRELTRGPALLLEPNPRWDPGADPLRQRSVRSIRIGPGLGSYDLAWPLATTSWNPAAEETARPLGYGLGPYLVVNLCATQRGGPARLPAVRRAIASAVDKAAVRDAISSAGAATIIQHGLLPPGSLGYGFAEPVVGERGDPDRARRELATAGFPEGVVLKLAVSDAEPDRRTAAVLREGFARAGITLQVQGHSAAEPWDIALDSHTPDWYGNNARTAVAPLVRGGTKADPANRSCYDNPVVNRLIAYALRDPSHSRAAELWRKVEALVMADLPIVPIIAHACGPCAAAANAAPRVSWFAE